jgi:hypothetical protein
MVLKARGSLLIWLDKDMCWHGSASGERGRREKYSEAAIQFCLTIKGLFNLAPGQTMGTAQSLCSTPDDLAGSQNVDREKPRPVHLN